MLMKTYCIPPYWRGFIKGTFAGIWVGLGGAVIYATDFLRDPPQLGNRLLGIVVFMALMIVQTCILTITREPRKTDSQEQSHEAVDANT